MREHPVDRRSDIYSFGATLYELATGRPAFDSAPHLLISQILNDEPALPRQIRPEIPRDLETIILTCLAKQSSRRYQTAQALASDLLAVLENRPILARRPPPAERIARYLKKHSKPIKGAATATAATFLLIAGAWLGWRVYCGSRLGRVELTNDGVPLTVQVLSVSDDTSIGEPFGLIRREVLTLPDGDYRLRASAKGRLSRTFRFAVNRGEMLTHPLSLDEGRLLGGEHLGNIAQGYPAEQLMHVAPVTRALELTPGKKDLIQRSYQSLIRRDAVTGRVIWDASRPAKPYAAAHDPAGWLRSFSNNKHDLSIVEPAPDVNGDGTADIISGFLQTPSLLAISGSDGSLIWSYTAELDGPGGPQPAGPEPDTTEQPAIRPGNLLGSPAVADCDRDGTLDVIATAVFQQTGQEKARQTMGKQSGTPTPNQPTLYRRIVVAVSGRSGRCLWSYSADPAFTALSWRAWKQAATVVRGRNSTMVAVPADANWVGLDPATGRPRTGPIDLGFAPVRPLQYADLDGDGESELLALGLGSAGNQQTLAAFSCTTGRELWVQPIAATFEWYEVLPDPDWPLVVDSDGDGRSEIIVPDSGSIAPRGAYRGIRLLDGASGRARWTHPLQPQKKASDAMEKLIAAPDLDADGARDLIVVSQFDGRNAPGAAPAPPIAMDQIYVDAISGKDGHALWSWHVNVPKELFIQFKAPQWWGMGPDQRPLLAVPLGGSFNLDTDPSRFLPPAVHVLEASTGREVHRVEGLTNPEVADFDGDGLTDLWGEVDRQIRAFRGEPPEAWRTLGIFWSAAPYLTKTNGILAPTVDFDGDDVADALNGGISVPSRSSNALIGTRTVIARSGRDGRTLWKTMLDPRRGPDDDDSGETYSRETFPLPAGDLNGDGTPEVFVTRSLPNPQKNTRKATLPLDLLSGRDGTHLWAAGPLPLAFEAIGYSNIRDIAVFAVAPRARARHPGGPRERVRERRLAPDSERPLRVTPGPIIRTRRASALGHPPGRSPGHVFWVDHFSFLIRRPGRRRLTRRHRCRARAAPWIG